MRYYLVRWDLVPYNPCTKVIQPKYKRTKMSCYDEETSKRLIYTLLAKAPMNFYVHSLESTDRASAELLEEKLINSLI